MLDDSDDFCTLWGFRPQTIVIRFGTDPSAIREPPQSCKGRISAMDSQVEGSAKCPSGGVCGDDFAVPLRDLWMFRVRQPLAEMGRSVLASFERSPGLLRLREAVSS